MFEIFQRKMYAIDYLAMQVSSIYLLFYLFFLEKNEKSGHETERCQLSVFEIGRAHV